MAIITTIAMGRAGMVLPLNMNLPPGGRLGWPLMLICESVTGLLRSVLFMNMTIIMGRIRSYAMIK